MRFAGSYTGLYTAVCPGIYFVPVARLWYNYLREPCSHAVIQFASTESTTFPTILPNVLHFEASVTGVFLFPGVATVHSDSRGGLSAEGCTALLKALCQRRCPTMLGPCECGPGFRPVIAQEILGLLRAW